VSLLPPPLASRKTDELLRHNGVGLAGDAFDARLFRQPVSRTPRRPRLESRGDKTLSLFSKLVYVGLEPLGISLFPSPATASAGKERAGPARCFVRLRFRGLLAGEDSPLLGRVNRIRLLAYHGIKQFQALKIALLPVQERPGRFRFSSRNQWIRPVGHPSHANQFESWIAAPISQSFEQATKEVMIKSAWEHSAVETASFLTGASRCKPRRPSIFGRSGLAATWTSQLRLPVTPGTNSTIRGEPGLACCAPCFSAFRSYASPRPPL